MQRHKPLARHRPLGTRVAKQRRATSADAEHKLWSLLRSHQFAGLRFRRQQPIGPYVVDFVCPAAKLIIEFDSDENDDDRRLPYDTVRTEWLTAHGYRVLRFPKDVLRNPQIILEAIDRALAIRAVPLPETRGTNIDARPPLRPPPSRGG